MSRLNRLSAAAIKAMFSSETDEQLIMLIEITDPTISTATQTISSTNEIAITNINYYNIDDNLIFTSSIGGLTAAATYYIVDIDYVSGRIKVSNTPRGTATILGSSTTQTTFKRVFRISDNWKERLSYTTDEEVIYGVKSTKSGFERQFIFIPVEIELPQETDSGETSCRLTINYVTQELIDLVRSSLTQPADVAIELVLSSSTNIIEAEFTGFFITNVNYNASQITFELNMIPLSREPFPAYNFTPLYFPGLF
jgi:hypothetical protein